MTTALTRNFGAYERACESIRRHPRRWLVTGSAGFIGSHLVEALLRLDQVVVGLDNLSTGHRSNLEEVRDAMSAEAWRRHTFVDGDISDLATCRRACEGVHFVLHEAALGSVPRSLADPLLTHASNATGFLNMLVAARDAGVQRIVYAASSSTYGDHTGLPKIEDQIGRPLSPYAVTKLVDELYADVFSRCYGLGTIGLRYFNVFGSRQDPDGAYAAVIPRWVAAMLGGQPVTIHGDGSTTRDFCHVNNVVQANLLAATTTRPEAIDQLYNIAVGDRTSLSDLYATLCELLKERHPDLAISLPAHEPFRSGDVRHSQADIRKAQRLLGFVPEYDVRSGLRAALPWYEARANERVRTPQHRAHGNATDAA